MHQLNLFDYSVKQGFKRQDSLKNYVNGLGTPQDMVTQAMPNADNFLTFGELDTIYRFNDLARRIVDEIVDDATKVSHSKVPLEDPFNIAELANQAGKLGRLYGRGSLLFITDARDTTKPLEQGEELRNIIVLDAQEVTPRAWQALPSQPGYAEPMLFDITPDTAVGSLSGVEYHTSRMAHFGGSWLPRRLKDFNDYHDDSVLQPVWAVIQRFEGAEMSIANIIQRFETATISIQGLADILSAQDGAQLIQQRIALMHQSLSLVNAAILDKDAGEEYSRAFATVNGMDTLWDRLAHSVAKAARMPMTRLFGMSPSGLSTDDQAGKANWRSQVAAYQKRYVKPAYEKYYRLLGQQPDIIFAPLDETSPMEEAQIVNKKVAAVQQLVAAGILSPEQGLSWLQDAKVIPETYTFEAPQPQPNPSPAGQEEGRPEGVEEEDPRE